MKQSQAPEIARQLGLDPDRIRMHSVSGGSIARAYRVEDGERRIFLKCMNAAQDSVLEAERTGLETLARSGTVQTPEVVAHGELDGVAWLGLEWLELKPLDGSSCSRLALELVELHQRSAGEFGFETDNFIGRTPQPNTRCLRWSEFFLENRLGYQLGLLVESEPEGGWSDWPERLAEAWTASFGGYQPRPALLHGDLWSGNAGRTSDGVPVLYDPAVHYGDRECDLAMADLFGGFHPELFSVYRGTWPLEPGWPERRRYYQLYHLLNHANLFAGHYREICRRLMADLVQAR